MDWKLIEKANKTMKRTPIKGKQYAQVNARVMAFREAFPNYALVTEILRLEEGMVVMQAIVKDEEGKEIATGTAYEREGASNINKTSFIENCETSAVGRALGFLGFGAEESIATAEEVDTAIQKQERMETKIKAVEAKAITSRIFDLENEGKVNVDKIRKTYGVKDFADLNYEQYDDLLRKLKRIEDAK